MLTYCIYHKADWDGVMSAAIVKRRFPDVILIPWDYGMPSPIGQIQPKSNVFVVDVCLEVEDMLKLQEKCSLCWCDHHKTQLEIPELKHIKGERSLNSAGCMLIFDHIFPFSKIPLGVQLLSKYDIWDHSSQDYWDNVIYPFQMGMRSYKLDPMDPVLGLILDHDEELVISISKQGFAIIGYEQSQAATYMRDFAYDAVLHVEYKTKTVLDKDKDGVVKKVEVPINPTQHKTYRVLAVNKQKVNSPFFDSKWDDDKYDIMIGYAHNGKITRYTMYSPRKGVDVGKIAQQFGGGGHRNAAGFETPGDMPIVRPL